MKINFNVEHYFKPSVLSLTFSSSNIWVPFSVEFVYRTGWSEKFKFKTVWRNIQSLLPLPQFWCKAQRTLWSYMRQRRIWWNTQGSDLWKDSKEKSFLFQCLSLDLIKQTFSICLIVVNLSMVIATTEYTEPIEHQ